MSASGDDAPDAAPAAAEGQPGLQDRPRGGGQFVTRDAVRATPISLSHESETKQRQLDNSEEETVELDGRQRFFSLRDTWSRWIIAWITASILTNVLLTFLVGAGVLDFQKYGWFINAVTVESFIQVIGLGYVAVRFLFSRG